MDEETPEDASAGRRVPPVVLVVGGLVLVVIAIAVGVMAFGGSEEEPAPPGYTAATEQAFLDACAADGGDPVRPTCQCFYDGIVETIPYERYDEVNDLLLAAPPAPGAPLALPDDFEAVLADCRRATDDSSAVSDSSDTTVSVDTTGSAGTASSAPGATAPETGATSAP